MNEFNVLQINCRCCGASVDTASNKCDYCQSPIRISSLGSTSNLSTSTLMKYAKSYENADQDGEDSNFARGIIFLKLGQLEKASENFSLSIDNNPLNADAFYYLGLTRLGGKKPFLCQRPVINKVIADLEAAIDIENKGIFHYCVAIIKFDYFKRKGFHIASDYIKSLTEAKVSGLVIEETSELREYLGVKLPEEFYGED